MKLDMHDNIPHYFTKQYMHLLNQNDIIPSRYSTYKVTEANNELIP